MKILKIKCQKKRRRSGNNFDDKQRNMEREMETKQKANFVLLFATLNSGMNCKLCHCITNFV